MFVNDDSFAHSEVGCAWSTGLGCEAGCLVSSA